MNELNPYAAPETDPTLAPTIGELSGLATPSERFTGAFIDGLIGIPIWGLLYFLGATELMNYKHLPGIGYSILFGIVYFSFLMAIQWKFLKATGQTIGKKVAKTRIVTMDGKKPEITDIVFKRYAFVSLLGIIPVVGAYLNLIDVLLVLRSDRRCLHDMIAGTQVVKFVPGQQIS